MSERDEDQTQVRRYKETWSPPWCSNVTGTYDMPRVFDENGMPEPQWIEMVCTHDACKHLPKPHYRLPCTSGNVRQHISRFALAHVHRDVFDTRTGSKP